MSKGLHSKSSARTASDPVPVIRGSLDRQQSDRASSSPINIAVTPHDLATPGYHNSQTSEGSTLGSGTTTTTVDDLGPVYSKADVVICGEVTAAKSSQSNETAQTMQAVVTNLQLQNAGDFILSQVKNALLQEPWFMKALDEVAKLHPFVAGAVLVFKAVYSLEMARRQNDKRVVVLYKKMRDMIEVLVRLKDMKDPAIIGPNGISIQDKMKTLVDEAAEEIKDCANACDTWMKKRWILGKVLSGPAWETKLAEYYKTFERRRELFEFALQIHTASVADEIQVTSRKILERLSHLTTQFENAFSQIRPVEEAQLAEEIAIDHEGGIRAVRDDENALRKLFDVESAKYNDNHRSSQDGDETTHPSANPPTYEESEDAFSNFKEELREGWDIALKKNLQAFEGKFQLYYDRLEVNLRKHMREDMREESNRVIDAMNRGPHDLIHDPELREIWTEMHWRRNVKAHKLVMTLHDYFADKAERAPASVQGDKLVSARSKHDTDSWARQFVGPKYLQPIMDAIDDDGSGHITIAEINNFTDSLPAELEWSLTLWLAYWAIGWQTFAHRYCGEILQIFARMFALREQVHPLNRDRVEAYLWWTWKLASDLAKSLSAPAVQIPDYAEEAFKAYIDYEENRIRQNLTGILYTIDAPETVYGVVGPGRIEKHALTLICLMLRKDLELLRIARTSHLHNKELQDAAMSVRHVLQTVTVRYDDLNSHFRQLKLDVEKEITSTAGELFKHYLTSETRQRMSSLATTYEAEPTDGELPGARLGARTPNKYPLQEDWPYRCEAYDTLQEVELAGETDIPEMLEPFLGRWSGFEYDHGFATMTFVTFHVHTAPAGGRYHVEAHGTSPGARYTFCAAITQEGQKSKITACKLKDSPSRSAGTLQPDGSIIWSSWNVTLRESNRFVWMRTPANLMTLRPMPPYNVTSNAGGPLVRNKWRAMFSYAIKAVIFQYRQKTWSWKYFAERRDVRLRYIDYCIRYRAIGRSNPDAQESLKRSRTLVCPMTSIDREVYESIAQVRWKTLPHYPHLCDTCHGRCHGVRLTCIDCKENATPEAPSRHTVDFCTLECSMKPVHPHPSLIKGPHDAFHTILKSRKVMQDRDRPLVYRRATAAIVAFQRRFGLVSTPQQGGNATELEGVLEPKVISRGPRYSECEVCHKTLAVPCWSCIDCFDQDKTNSYFICDECEDECRLQCVRCKKPFKQPRWWYGLDFGDKFTCSICTVRQIPVRPTVRQIPVQPTVDQVPARPTRAGAPVRQVPVRPTVRQFPVRPTVQRRRGPIKPADVNTHTYLHYLVRCYPQKPALRKRSIDSKIDVVETTVAKLDQRVATLESQVVAIDRKLTDQLDTLGRHVESMDGRLSRLEGAMERIERLLSM